MRVFLPSMIEVSFSEYYKKCTKLLFESNFKSFHIDFGDGMFIGRKIDAWNKVNFLKSLGADIKLTAHIMCRSGDHIGSLKDVTNKCIK